MYYAAQPASTIYKPSLGGRYVTDQLTSFALHRLGIDHTKLELLQPAPQVLTDVQRVEILDFCLGEGVWTFLEVEQAADDLISILNAQQAISEGVLLLASHSHHCQFVVELFVMGLGVQDFAEPLLQHVTPAESFEGLTVQPFFNALSEFLEEFPASNNTLEKVVVIPLGKQLDDAGKVGVVELWVSDLAEEKIDYVCVEFNEGTADEGIQQMLILTIVDSRDAFNGLLGDCVVREVAIVVVVFKGIQDIPDAEVVETQRLEKHLVDGGAADDGVVSEVVVVGLVEERLLL